MAKQYGREEIRQRFRREIEQGNPIIIPSAGNGISAKFAEKGGADMIGLFNSGHLAAQEKSGEKQLRRAAGAESDAHGPRAGLLYLRNGL